MGYDLHITRREDWADESGREISSEEWLSLVEKDKELELDPDNGACFASCQRQGEPDEQWLDWSDGDLFTKNPEKWFVAKMIDLAAELDARVVGDDGEEYTRTNLDERFGDAPPAHDQFHLPEWIATPLRSLHLLLRHRWPKHPPPPYRVGDRIRVGPMEVTVVKLQRTAEFGYGRLVVEHDNGGRESILLLGGENFERVDPEPSD